MSLVNIWLVERVVQVWSIEKPTHYQITFDTQLKTILNETSISSKDSKRPRQQCYLKVLSEQGNQQNLLLLMGDLHCLQSLDCSGTNEEAEPVFNTMKDDSFIEVQIEWI